ncbi:MAG: DUF3795 domain-containing protein [Bacteroidales bacterium]|nr:DUF3795 domain-containing protein [Bacteroidales bacterium]
MKPLHIAPCGIICNICHGFQRNKNTCVGCLADGNKAYRCDICSFKMCPEKKGNSHFFCFDCEKFPCRRLNNLEKRYVTNYSESPIQNLMLIREIGLDAFIKQETIKWLCPVCGQLLCVHKNKCLHCGNENIFYKRKPKN